MEKTYETNSADETALLGKKIAKGAVPGQVYALSGDLGCGKTVLAKGFAEGLGVKDTVNSPTFTILKSYEGDIPLHHFDVYRIGDISEMDEIGYEDCFYGDGVSLVEWPELIKELLPPQAIWIKIEKDPDKGFDHRRITIADENTRS